jgi:hypothetical protein
MNTNGLVVAKRRLSRMEAERLVCEFEESGLRRKEFCARRGLNLHTFDAWRKRIAQLGSAEKIVPVEIVEDHGASRGSMRAGSLVPNGQFRIVLTDGLRIEVEPGFDAAELLRLIAVLDGGDLRSRLSRPV